MLATRNRLHTTAASASPQGRRVLDVMTSFLITVPIHASLARAAKLIDQYHVTGLPVLDAGGRAVGVISQTDLLREAIDDRHGPQSWRYRKVGDAMTSPPITIDGGASPEAARRIMASQRISRLLVLDSFGRPRGILTRSNL